MSKMLGNRPRRSKLFVSMLVVVLFASTATVTQGALRDTLNLPLQITRVQPTSARAGEVVTLTVPAAAPLAPGLAITVRGRTAAVVTRGLNTVAIRLPAGLLAGHAIINASSTLHRPGESAVTVIPSAPLYDGTVAPVPDESLRSEAVIGQDGGTIETSGIELDVAPGALDAPVSISVTPMISATGAPIQFVAGAIFEPNGLTFAQPAVITVRQTDLPTGLVGFVFEGVGTDLLVRPADLSEGGARLEIEHFTGGGLGNVTEADFRRLVEPFLSAPFPLSLQRMEQMVELIVAFELRFGNAFCQQSVACGEARSQMSRSVYNRIDAACALGRQNPPAPELLIKQILNLRAVLQAIRDPQQDRGESCQHEMMSNMIEEAGAEAVSRPSPDVLIRRLVQLGVDAALLGFDDLQERAEELAGQAVDVIINAALPRCDGGDAEEIEAEGELRRALNLHLFGELGTFSDSQIRDFIEGCGLQIAIAGAGQLVAFAGVPVNVKALITHSTSDRVAWRTDGGTISGSELTATFQDSAVGTRNITATSIANPSKSAQSPIEVVDDGFRTTIVCNRTGGDQQGDLPIQLHRERSSNANVEGEGYLGEPPVFRILQYFGPFDAFSLNDSNNLQPGFRSATIIPIVTMPDGQVVRAPSSLRLRVEDTLSFEEGPNTTTEIQVNKTKIFDGNDNLLMSGERRGIHSTCTPQTQVPVGFEP